MSLCKHCVQGVRHEGTPEGTTEKVGGVETYIATPSIDYPKDKAILFLSDVFGLKLNNNLLLADDFAKNGFKVYIPDLFDGDALPADAMDPGSNYDVMKWFSIHGPPSSTPKIQAVIDALNAQGITKIGAVGFCYGARGVFDFAFQHKTHVSVATHPSLLQPEDLEKYAKEATAPLLLNTCEVDSQFPPEKQAKADEILGNGKFAPGYERTYWAGCTHGFAVRGDINDPKTKEGKEGAFKATVEFFIKHL
ncbi:alpha/beta-hydrolase [Dentipellis sp. KUC8613]|nr:alpha/beta-hydrolase [Dentipellis sp. KUC8613]